VSIRPFIANIHKLDRIGHDGSLPHPSVLPTTRDSSRRTELFNFAPWSS
jgi:hypothetical protein